MTLKLDQEVLYEVMEDRGEVARGIFRVLCRRLREHVGIVQELQSQPEA